MTIDQCLKFILHDLFNGLHKGLGAVVSLWDILEIAVLGVVYLKGILTIRKMKKDENPTLSCSSRNEEQWDF